MIEFLKIKKIRIAACERSLYLFAIFYFLHYFIFESAPFHKDWASDLNNDNLRGYINLGFRESAKTSWIKIKIIHSIVYRKNKYIIWVSYDKSRGASNLYDIVMELQHNKKIIDDFGMLYLTDKKQKKSQMKKKSKEDFITENLIKVQAVGTTIPLRGYVYGEHRPDLIVMDDIENNKTKKSATVTQNVIAFIDETLSGMAHYARCIFNCNYISDYGTVRYLLDKAERNPKTWKVSWIDAEIIGKPAWPAKYTMTDAEAAEYNKDIADPKLRKESLESKKRELGDTVYAQEMLNQPASKGDKFFDIPKIDARIEAIKSTKWQKIIKFVSNNDGDLIQAPDYYEEIQDWKIWGHYLNDGRYGIAADVAEGYGNDSSVIQVWDLNTGVQVREFESKFISPSVLGLTMVDEGKKAYFSILCPERNSIGIAVIDAIKNENYRNLYREKTVDTVTNRPMHKFGWHTNAKTKPLMLFEFKRDFEAGLITINSIQLLKEMRLFTNDKISETSSDPDVSRHYDRLMAACIVWQMRKVKSIKGFINVG